MKCINIILTIQSKQRKLETTSIFIDEKRYKDLVIYFTRYKRGKIITMLNLHYHELMGKNNEHEGKNI